ncbi:MAG: MFS transporter [Erysipelotrichaceae bacterium]|nr:MFS transporter [Erysipelotrichaceae bacterium]
MKKQNNILLIFSLCLMAACSVGLYTNSTGVFFTPIAESLNEKRGNVAVFYTIMIFANAIFSVIIPTRATNKNFKKIYIGGVIGCLCSLILMSNATSLIMLYIGGLLLGASFSTFFVVVLTTIINCSFTENTGTITGFVLSFSGLAGAVFSPLLSSVINAYDWHIAFYVMAGITVLLCLPAIFAEMKIEQEKTTVNASSAKFNYLSTGFLMIVAMYVFYMYLPALPQHLPGIASSKSMDQIGSLLVSSCMIGNIVFKLVAGILADKLGSIKAMFIMSAVTLTGAIMLLITETTLSALIGSFLFGAIFSVAAVLSSYHVRTVFGTENYKKAYSVMSMAGNINNAFSIAAIGYIYDFFASYNPAIILAIAFDIIAFILALLAKKKVLTKSNQ